VKGRLFLYIGPTSIHAYIRKLIHVYTQKHMRAYIHAGLHLCA